MKRVRIDTDIEAGRKETKRYKEIARGSRCVIFTPSLSLCVLEWRGVKVITIED